jgi:prefoldin subunit 1
MLAIPVPSGLLLIRSQLVHEIESQAISAQRDISLVKSAVSTKQRDIRMLELTSSEVNQLPKDTRMYEGVGKM